MRSIDDLEFLYVYRQKLAELLVENETYSPIFLRLDSEISSLEEEKAARDAGDAIERARAIARRGQNAIA